MAVIFLSMWLFLGQTIWFFFPAGIANIGASFSRYVPLLNKRVDGGCHWRGKPIFGAHKTWRGLVVGTLTGVLFFLLQQYLFQYDVFRSISIIDYSSVSWTYGLLLGLGSVGGDLLKSFFKRRINIAPGHPWVPFDQIDYVVGAVIVISLVYFPGWDMVLSAIILGFVFHISFNLLGYLLGLQKNKL